MRTAARVDANQPKVVKQLRSLGFSVLIVSQLKNCFDFIVGHRGHNFNFELKDPDKSPSQKKLTEGEQKFADGWKGQVDKVESIEEILNVINGYFKSK